MRTTEESRPPAVLALVGCPEHTVYHADWYMVSRLLTAMGGHMTGMWSIVYEGVEFRRVKHPSGFAGQHPEIVVLLVPHAKMADAGKACADASGARLLEGVPDLVLLLAGITRAARAERATSDVVS